MRVAESIRVNVTPFGLVVLDINQRRIFTANSVAAHIWQGLMIDKKSRLEVVNSLVGKYESTREVVEKDLSEFIQILTQQQILIE